MSMNNTPLRYPGGKQKLTPFVLEILEENDLLGGHYAEPYAGGAGIGINLLVSGVVSRIHLNDSAFPVYAFWHSILTRAEEMCARIMRASLTVKEWRRQKEILARHKEHDEIDVGFSFFYMNRCNRSGIHSGGVIGGLAQDGHWKMDARFPRNEMIRRIEVIAERRGAVSLRNMDAEEFIRKHVPKLPKRSLVYCDPPYFNNAKRLYLDHYRPEDHARIAMVFQREIKRPWVVSYDSVPDVMEYYSKRRSILYDLQYSAAKAYVGKEVFFFSDDLSLPAISKVPSIDRALAGCGGQP
jgi:DNA adenine methylase